MDKNVNRMFDFAGFYSYIAMQLPGNARIAEVGVADGDSAIYLAREAYKLDKLGSLYLIDNMAYGGMNQLNDLWKRLIDEIPALLKYITIIPESSLDASCKFNDHSLDFVFIDSSHTYEQTKAEARLWYRKVKDEGILAGHDYSGHAEVRRAIDEVMPDPVNGENEHGETLAPITISNGMGIWYIRKHHKLIMK